MSNAYGYIGESQETEVQTKTYFWTNTLFNRFPPEFVSSKNRKWIVVQGCKATFKDKLVGDVTLLCMQISFKETIF